MLLTDIFNTDAFSVVSLTDAILKAPHKPGLIGEIGLFREGGITTTTVVVEEKDGQLFLIESTPRGGPGSTIGAKKRTARSFLVPHLERDSTIMADEVQDVRAFGSEMQVEGVQAVVNERLATLRAMHEVTLEHHRVGAIQGKILDADGTTVLFDLFTEFAVSQQTKDFALSAATTNVRGEVIAATRLSEDELEGQMVTDYVGLCSDGWFDDFVGHDKVKETFLNWSAAQELREDVRRGFRFGGVTWVNYRGKVKASDDATDVNFIPANEAFLVPRADIFRTYFAPADFIETVNTVGLPLYSKISVDQELNRWAKVHSQSNPMCLCLRPRAVIRLTKS